MKTITTKLDGNDRLTARDSMGQKVTIPYPHDLDETEAHKMAAREWCSKYHWPMDFITGYLGGDERVYVHVFKR